MHEDVKSKRWISMGGSKTEEELVRKAMSWSMSRGTVSRREDILDFSGECPISFFDFKGLNDAHRQAIHTQGDMSTA